MTPRPAAKLRWDHLRGMERGRAGLPGVDTAAKLPSIYSVKACLPIILVLALGAALSRAQSSGWETTRPEQAPASTRYGPNLLRSLATEDAKRGDSEVVLKKRLHLGGPLVGVFKGKTLFEAPRRWFHLINPFAKTEPRTEFENTRDLSPRAWTTTVGWRGGASAFPDPVSHESSLGLFSAHR